MRREPHPLTGTMYEDIGDGKVKVQKEGSNSYGVFTWQGEWLEGEVTQADPQMLLYIGGPKESIMDILLLAPWPKDKPRPTPAKPRHLGFDDAWTAAPELLSLSKITDQDVFNVPSVQRGLKAKNPPHVWYSAYQEMKIRNFHNNYETAPGLEDDTIRQSSVATGQGDI